MDNIFASTIQSTAVAIAKATVQVEIKSSMNRTTYILTGERAAVDEKINSIMRDYHPYGYGTFATYTDTGAIVTRANSCD